MGVDIFLSSCMYFTVGLKIKEKQTDNQVQSFDTNTITYISLYVQRALLLFQSLTSGLQRLRQTLLDLV